MRGADALTTTAADTDGAPGQRSLAQVVDLARYPLDQPGSPEWHAVADAARHALRDDGCCVLRDFVPGQGREAVRRECAAVAGRAYYDERIVNVYNTAPGPDLPAEHPARQTMPRGNAFVAGEDIPGDFLIRRLYDSSFFRSFLAACLGAPVIHPLGDPLAGLVVNVLLPGREHPWHFDTNEFAVSLVTQEPEGGGVFEYCPGIRSAVEENLAGVAQVLLAGGGDRVRRLPPRAGDLQLFHGRYSMHRVTPVDGERARYSVIFSYCDRPGVVGSPERTRQLFGRLSEVHQTSARVRADGLLD
jgi:hypothetical protein